MGEQYDGTNTLSHMVCYKEGTLRSVKTHVAGNAIQQQNGQDYGVTDAVSSGNACKPENALSGEISWDGNTSTIVVPDTYKRLRFWRNTSVAI
jgi:hypothetical protein